MVKEEGKTLLSVCGVLLSPISVVSETGKVDIYMRSGSSKQQLYAKRNTLHKDAQTRLPLQKELLED